MYWFLFLLGLAFVSAAYVFWSLRRRRVRIPELQKKHLRQAWDDAVEIKDPAQRVLHAEKVADAVLKALGYGGTFAEKLQKAHALLADIDAVWDAHRLRNTVAHELHVHVSRAQSDRALAAFGTIVHRFLA